MTIKLDALPSSQHIIILLDKNQGVKDVGMIDPKNLGKAEAKGVIVAKGSSVGDEHSVGRRVFIPLTQQKETFIYDGNLFSVNHHSYITVFMTDEYEVEI